jgi:hypothetical protein
MDNTAQRTRHNRTITVDFQDEATYFRLLDDGKAFVECASPFSSPLAFSSHTRPPVAEAGA